MDQLLKHSNPDGDGGVACFNISSTTSLLIGDADDGDNNIPSSLFVAIAVVVVGLELSIDEFKILYDI